jgi:hypothetical protein
MQSSFPCQSSLNASKCLSWFIIGAPVSILWIFIVIFKRNLRRWIISRVKTIFFTVFKAISFIKSLTRWFILKSVLLLDSQLFLRTRFIIYPATMTMNAYLSNLFPFSGCSGSTYLPLIKLKALFYFLIFKLKRLIINWSCFTILHFF